MRALLPPALLLSGCTSLLGISDPTPATGDGGPDVLADSNIDAPPPCTDPIALGADISTDLGKTGTDFVIGRFDNGLPEDLAIATGADVTIVHGDRTGAFAGDGEIIVIPTAATDLALGDWDINVSADDDLAMFTAGGTAVIARRQNRANDPPVEGEQPLTGPFTNVRRVIADELGGNLNTDLIVYDDGGSRVYTASGASPGEFLRDANAFAPAADELLLVRQIDGASRADALFVNGSQVKLMLQTNAGFQAPTVVASTAASKGIAVGRFDGDALVDIVVSTAVGLELYLQVPAAPGTFMLHGVISPLTSATPMLVGDVNGDGRDDILLANAAILQCAAPAAGAPGVFTQVEALSASPPAKLVDVTGDGKLDLVRLEGTSIKVRVAQ